MIRFPRAAAVVVGLGLAISSGGIPFASADPGTTACEHASLEALSHIKSCEGYFTTHDAYFQYGAPGVPIQVGYVVYCGTEEFLGAQGLDTPLPDNAGVGYAKLTGYTVQTNGTSGVLYFAVPADGGATYYRFYCKA